MNGSITRVVAMLALVTLTASCAQVRGERQTQGIASSTTVVEVSETVPARPQAKLVSTVAGDDSVFAFTATELHGRSGVSGLDLVENRLPLIMTFVVPSCAVCVVEGPEIAASAAENPDVTYVVVHSAGSVSEYEAYIGATGLYFENIVHLDDSDGTLWRRFGVMQQPTTVLVGADGAISQSIGALELEGLKKAVDLVYGPRPSR